MTAGDIVVGIMLGLGIVGMSHCGYKEREASYDFKAYELCVELERDTCEDIYNETN